MLHIGLTGGIGSGKSTVTKLFSEYNICIIDADIISRQVSLPGTPGYQAIQAHFGQQAVTQTDINRAWLRDYIFKNNHAKQELEAILHPLIWQAMDQALDQSTSPYTISAIPLLFESKKDYKLDRILVVDVPEALQIARASQRDHTTPEEIQRIMAQQISRQERLKRADDIIDNSKDLDTLKQQVKTLHYQYLQLS